MNKQRSKIKKGESITILLCFDVPITPFTFTPRSKAAQVVCNRDGFLQKVGGRFFFSRLSLGVEVNCLCWWYTWYWQDHSLFCMLFCKATKNLCLAANASLAHHFRWHALNVCMFTMTEPESKQEKYIHWRV